MKPFLNTFHLYFVICWYYNNTAFIHTYKQIRVFCFESLDVENILFPDMIMNSLKWVISLHSIINEQVNQ
jgi:hypothetical protein